MIATTQIKRNENGDPAIIQEVELCTTARTANTAAPLVSGFTQKPLGLAV